jgi:hypothetical protein
VRDTPLLLEMRERFERSHEEAQEVIAESRWLRLKSRELLDRVRRVVEVAETLD